MNFTISQKGDGSLLEFTVDGTPIPTEIAIEYLNRLNPALSAASAAQSAEQFLMEALRGKQAPLSEKHSPFERPVAGGGGRIVCSCGWEGTVSDYAKRHNSDYFSPEDVENEFEQHQRDAMKKAR